MQTVCRVHHILREFNQHIKSYSMMCTWHQDHKIYLLVLSYCFYLLAFLVVFVHRGILYRFKSILLNKHMFAYFRKKKWNLIKTNESKNNQPPFLIAIFMGILEDILFWERVWQSVIFIFFLHILFIVCLIKDINLFEIILYFGISIIAFDAIEAWLKYKHRTTCLKKITDHDATRLKNATTQVFNMIKRKFYEFMYLRETNHAKAFLLVNIILGIVFFIGKYITGYLLLYTSCMVLCLFHKISPKIGKLLKKLQQNAESDYEYEGLIPDVSDVERRILSIESENNQIVDDKQSLDYWKPEDVPIEEVSDSSDNSSSLVTNIPIEKMKMLDKDIETSDSSEDEYIPTAHQKEQLKSTVEIIEPTNTWSNAAFSAFQNLTGAMANIMYTAAPSNRKRVSSVDSSDGFEMIDKNDLNN